MVSVVNWGRMPYVGLRPFADSHFAEMHQPNRSLRFVLKELDNDLSGEVDRILEKISSKGVDSLTSDEHDTMRRYAKTKK